MEQALRETVRLPFVAGLDLDQLITAAGQQPCTDDQALDAIVNVRAVVERLYRPWPTDE